MDLFQQIVVSLTLPGLFYDLPGTFEDIQLGKVADNGIPRATLGSDRKPVFNSTVNHPTVTSASTFAKWFNRVSGFNIPIKRNLTLQNTVANPNTFALTQTNWYPLAGAGLGNDAAGKNNYFTFELHMVFTYLGYETFTFTGNDDIFVFINNK